jgi:DNA replication protein DnaC
MFCETLLDDWGLAPRRDENRREVLELLEDRHGRGATLVTSPFPVEHWHDAIGAPTLADAILDRLLHNAYKIPLRGDAMRTQHAAVKNDVPFTSPDQPRRRCAPMAWQLSSG